MNTKKIYKDFIHVLKTENKIIVSLIIIFAFVLTSSVFAKTAGPFRPYDVDKDGVIDAYDYWILTNKSASVNNYAIAKLPQRIFTLDMKGFSIDNSTGDTDSKLTEYTPAGQKLDDWKVDIEKKGHARNGCKPPMFNMSFDKFDSKGNPKPLFPGISTFGSQTSSLYQKVRVVENCDAFNDALSHSPFFGLKGALTPQFREYVVYRTMRLLGVPSVEPVAFAKLKMLNTDQAYLNKEYSYMFMQRDNELDDAQPFVRQFGLEDGLIQDGDNTGWQGDWNKGSNRLDNVAIINTKNESKTLTFNPEDSIRHFLVTALVNDTDRSVLHNEDYGQITGSDKWKSILYGFDFSFTECRAPLPYYPLVNAIDRLDATKKAEFQKAYYKVAREMFTKNENLYKILFAIDQYPNPVSDRSRLIVKKYMRLSFYEYGQYFNTKEFADSLGQPFVPVRFSPIFTEAGYQNMRNDFDQNLCKQDVLPAPKVKVTVIPEQTRYQVTNNQGSERYDISLATPLQVQFEAPEQDLKIPKQGAFRGSVFVRKTDTNIENTFISDIPGSIDRIKGDVTDEGAFYLIKKGQTGSVFFTLRGYDQRDSLRNLAYSMSLSTFRSSAEYNFLNLPVLKSKEVIVDSSLFECVANPSLKRILVSPNSDKSFTLKWGSANIGQFDVQLFDANNTFVSTIEEEVSAEQAINGFNWTPLSHLSDGQYFVRVSSVCDKNVYGDSPLFYITSSKKISFSIKEKTPAVASVLFDQSKQEVSLDGRFEVLVSALGGDVLFDKFAGQALYERKDNREKYGETIRYVATTIESSEGFEVNGNTYRLKDGQTGHLKLKASQPTRALFSGRYNMYLQALYGFDETQRDIRETVQNPLVSNEVVIVGEKSPYLFESRKEPFAFEETVVVNGERINGADIVTISQTNTNVQKTIPVTQLAYSSNYFSFRPIDYGLLEGDYRMSLNGPLGQSNSIGLSIAASNPMVKKQQGFFANIWDAVMALFN